MCNGFTGYNGNCIGFMEIVLNPVSLSTGKWSHFIEVAC